MKYINKRTIFTATLGLLLFAVSCEKDLEREPITDVTSASVYKDFANYPSALGKLYAGLALGGQSGGDGNADVSGIDGGFSNYLRQFYNMQVLTTDEAVVGWNDDGLPDLHKMTWNTTNPFINAIYYRIYNVIAVSNEFIKNTSDGSLAANGITGANATEAKYMRAEARFLRAQSYYHALDLFGNVPFVDENTPAGELPKRITRAELFTWVESELLAVANDLKDPKTNEYGRADKASAGMLLAKLYLNAGVYTGTTRYADCKKALDDYVLTAGYAIDTNFADTFKGDNNLSTEIIFPIISDPAHAQSYGNVSYLINAAGIGKTDGIDLQPAFYLGSSGQWGGNKTTKEFISLFSPGDKRAMFDKRDGLIEFITDLSKDRQGYRITKFTNIRRNGTYIAGGSDSNFVDTDFPLFRLSDAYLMAAECAINGAGSLDATVLGNLNKLRQRAGMPTVTAAAVNSKFLIDERGRELFWECHRRTDLIRFGKFTGASKIWQWKGGVKNGSGTEEFRNLMPIPSKTIQANPTLKQNPGY